MPCCTNTRKKYQLIDQNDKSYYLQLTEDQARLIMWFCNNDISTIDCELNEMENIEWEAP